MEDSSTNFLYKQVIPYYVPSPAEKVCVSLLTCSVGRIMEVKGNLDIERYLVLGNLNKQRLLARDHRCPDWTHSGSMGNEIVSNKFSAQPQ